MIHATFIMEQHLGHQVHYQNLRRFISEDQRVRAAWVPVTYTGKAGLFDHLPFRSEKLKGSLIGRMQVRRGLQIEPCDILYFNTQVPAVLHSPQSIGRPYIIATDITPIQLDQMAGPYNHTPDQKGPLQKYKYWATTRVLRAADRLLPWSSWAASSLIKDYGVDPERVEVMPVGVDLGWWLPAGLSPHPQARILFVGGDFVRKGGNLLLEAFRSLPKGSAELVIVTRSLVLPEDNVTVYSNIQPNSIALRNLYQSSDIFVLPSTAEAFGISAVEGCAAGLPVIAASTGGLSDIVQDQVSGYLVPVGDAQALALRLKYLVENIDVRQAMGRASYLRAQTRFDAKKNAARLVDIMLEIVTTEGRR